VNDGGSNAPRLNVQQSWWAMKGLGDGKREWTMEEKFKKIAGAGFDGVFAQLPELNLQDKWISLLDEYKLSYGIQTFPKNREEFIPLLKRAKDLGAQYINAQVADSFIIGDEAIQLLTGLLEEGTAADIPVFVESHRGRITQDLLRTAKYVQMLPNLRLTIDFSHYILAGEIEGYNEKAEQFFDILLQRTSCIHGRVSNGQQIQVNIDSYSEQPMLEHFVRWWEKGILNWLQAAQRGDIFPFVCELGPPNYAMTRVNQQHSLIEENSNRWQQSLILKRLAEELWIKMLNVITKK
jgi:hypothetical protein